MLKGKQPSLEFREVALKLTGSNWLSSRPWSLCGT